MVIDVSQFERNQRRSREDYQELGPALLQVNADTLGEEDRRIEKRQETGNAQLSVGQHSLHFVQEVEHDLAMSEKDLFVGPIGKRVEPKGAAIQDEKGESYA